MRDLAVSYPGRDVFRGVDLTLRGGEFVGLLGPNGAGKTTLMRAVLGLIPADAGTVSAGRRPVRKVVGYVPQAHNVAWDFPIDVYDATLNATLGQRPWWQRAGEREHRAAERALAMVNLTDLAARPIHDLSGGQRQRVLIAMAMAGHPDLLICDEPTTALDATTQDGVLRVIERVTKARGTALVFITHDLGVIRRMCPNVLVMHQGAVVESGPTERVLAQPEHPYTRTLIASSRPPELSLSPATAEDALVTLRGVSKVHGAHAALDGIDLRVHHGERLGIVGGSGSGKTSLLKLIAGLDQPTSGDIDVRGRVQMVFQDPQGSLNPRLKIWKSIAEAIPCLLYTSPSPRDLSTSRMPSSA